jgi:predicted nucleic-acid-binding protein
MIGLDTNVIVRFLVRDDEKQAQSVYARFKKAEMAGEHLCISLTVILETIWVLESAYGLSRDDILGSFETMRQMPLFEFENGNVLDNLINEGRKTRLDLSDLLIAFSAQAAGCDSVLTFDKKASRLSLFELIK